MRDPCGVPDEDAFPPPVPPPPPVPADADLRHFANMPLDVGRLRDSRLAGEGDAEIFRCALLLWCAAWHQLPAGSLPPDDVSLARLAGLGRDLRGWGKIKAAALRGFRLFEDGRLYHPVLSEKAVESWNSTRHHQWTLACERTRKENSQRKAEGRLPLPPPPRPQPCKLAWPAEIRRRSGNALTESGQPVDGIPLENGLKRREEKRISSVAEGGAASAREARRVEPRLARSAAGQAMAEELAKLASKRRAEVEAEADAR